MTYNGPTCYCYSFDTLPSTRDWSEVGDGLTIELRLWEKNETDAEVVRIAQTEFNISLYDAAVGARGLILELRDYFTMLGIPEECHAKMTAGLMEFIDMGFLCSVGNLFLYARQNVVMDIVEEWGMLGSNADIENAVRRAMGVEIVRQGGEWLRWWEIVAMCVQELVLTGDDEFVEEVWDLRMHERVEDQLTSERSAGTMMDEEEDMDEVMRVSMEEYTARMVPANEAAIAKLEKVVDEVDVLCVICNEEEEQGFSRIPCGHMFHTECVETWLRISSSCPLCRYVLQ